MEIPFVVATTEFEQTAEIFLAAIPAREPLPSERDRLAHLLGEVHSVILDVSGTQYDYRITDVMRSSLYNSVANLMKGAVHLIDKSSTPEFHIIIREHLSFIQDICARVEATHQENIENARWVHDAIFAFSL